MRSSDDILNDRVKALPTSDSFTATFVRMDGNLAVVNTGGGTTISIPCVGFYPPTSGVTVQVEKRNQRYAVTGQAVPLPGVGVIKSTGSPEAVVTVGGNDYSLFYASDYTPSIGDQVEVSWENGVIRGKITGSNSGTDPGTLPGGGPDPISNDPVLAFDSGQFRSRWQSNTVRASDTVSGAWVYNGRVAAALAGVTVAAIGIYLPLANAPLGSCFIGTHGYAVLPGGWTGIANQVPLSPRGGWVALPVSFAAVLAAGGGIAVTSGSGDNIWSGTQSDPLSGALRFVGTR